MRKILGRTIGGTLHLLGERLEVAIGDLAIGLATMLGGVDGGLDGRVVVDELHRLGPIRAFLQGHARGGDRSIELFLCLQALIGRQVRHHRCPALQFLGRGVLRIVEKGGFRARCGGRWRTIVAPGRRHSGEGLCRLTCTGCLRGLSSRGRSLVRSLAFGFGIATTQQPPQQLADHALQFIGLIDGRVLPKGMARKLRAELKSLQASAFERIRRRIDRRFC